MSMNYSLWTTDQIFYSYFLQCPFCKKLLKLSPTNQNGKLNGHAQSASPPLLICVVIRAQETKRGLWYDMIWYDMIWYDMIWYDMIWYDMEAKWGWCLRWSFFFSSVGFWRVTIRISAAHGFTPWGGETFHLEDVWRFENRKQFA